VSEQVWISVNGTPLQFIGYWGDPVITHRWPYGSWELRWRMELKPNQRTNVLRRNADVIAYVGPSRVWRGYLTEPDFDSGEFIANGAARQGETAQAFDESYNATTVPNTAIDEARMRGALWWTRSNLFPISADPFGTVDADEFGSVNELLDAWSVSVAKKWWIDPDLYVRADADPTTPMWQVTPGAGTLGVADSDYWTHLYAVYDTGAGYAKVTASDTSQNVGRVERRIDLTDRGILTAPQAQGIVDGLIAQGIARTGWANGIQVGHGQVLTMGSTAASLSQVRAGHMVRLNGLFDERGLSAFTDIVIGESVWNVAADELQLNPVGLAARDLSSIVESAGGSLD
jgi:hypothetical protein